nr:hypothetical protein [Tanacetum cinerariifolium]
MVAILEKSKHNIDFHPMVDFVEASPIRVTIAKSSTLLYDSAPKVTSPAAEEGSMQQSISELTVLCTSLQRKLSELLAKFQAQEVEINRLKERVKILEDKGGVIGDRSGDDAPIKGRRIDEDEVATERVSDDTEEVRLDEGEVAAERASEDTEEMATVLIAMDTTTVLASGTTEVPTGSGSIPTADEVPTGSDVVSTASPVFATATMVTPYRRRKGKEVMVDYETPKKQKLQEQIDAQIARELKEQLEREDQRRSNEVISKHLAEYEQATADLTIRERIELINELVKYQDHHSKILQYQAKQKKPRTKKQKRDFYVAVIRNNLGWKAKDFKGMSLEEVEAKFKTVWEPIEGGVSKISKGEAVWLERKGIRSEQESAEKLLILEELREEVKSSVEVPKEKIKEMMQLVPIEKVYVEALQVKHPIIDWKVHTEGQRAYWKIIRLGGSSASYQFFTDLLKHLDKDDLNQLCASTDLKGQRYFHACGEGLTLRKGLALVMICYKFQVENYLQMAGDLGRIVGNKMHKAFPLPAIKFPLSEELPTASEDGSHCQKKRDATARKIALLSMSRRNCQSKMTVTLNLQRYNSTVSLLFLILSHFRDYSGKGSGTPTEPHHTPYPEADTLHPTTSSIPLPSIPTAPIPLVTQPNTTPIRQYSRKARIGQSPALLTVADEPTSPVRDVNEGEACPTDSGFIADQDRATIAK